MNRRAFIAASLALPFTLQTTLAKLVSAYQGYVAQGEITDYTFSFYLRAEPTPDDAKRVARQNVQFTQNSSAKMIFGGEPDLVPMKSPAKGILTQHLRGPAAVGDDLEMNMVDLLGVRGNLFVSASIVWVSGMDEDIPPQAIDHFATWFTSLDEDAVHESVEDLEALFPDLRPFAVKEVE